MRHLLIALFLTFAATALFTPGALAQSGEDLFQQALRTERLSGNMEAAVSLYEQIIEEHGDDRELSANALLQLARAYEALGRTEARRAYGTIASDYQDFPQLAAEARVAYERLSPKPEGKPPGEISVLRTHPDATSWGASLSRDGSVLVTATYGEELDGIALQNLETGAVTLTDLDMAGEARGTPELVRLSPDGTKLAAGWFLERNFTIRVRDLESGRVSQVVDAAAYTEARLGQEADGGGAHIDARDWTSDGRSILVWFAGATADSSFTELALVHLDGSFPTPIAPGEGLGSKACITSDSRFVFAARWDDRPYIERIDVETGERTTWRKSSEQGVDLVGCVDDPSRVLFSEDFLGGKRLMSAGADELGGNVDVHAHVPSNSAFGVPSRRGDIIYWPESDWSELVAAVDAESLDLTSSLSALGRISQSLWSPIDNRIAWLDPAKSETVLWNADTGARTILNNPTGARPAYFSSDGSTLKMNDGDAGYVYLNLETGETQRVTNDLFERLGTQRSGGADPTGYEYALDKDGQCLVRLDMRAEAASPLWCPDDGLALRRMRVSPDHSKIVVERRRPREGDDPEYVSIDVIDVQTGAVRTVLEGYNGPQGHALGRANWAGDDAILVTGHSPKNPFLITALNVFDLRTGESRPVLGGLLDLATTGGTVQLSQDHRHVIAWGSPRAVGGDPNQVTIIHRAAEARVDR